MKKCKNENKLYIGDDKECYAIGEPEKYNLLVVGLSPTDATFENPTIKRIRKIAEQQGYYGWIMVNLYPVRIADPDNLPDKMDDSISGRNIEVIKKLQDEYVLGDVYAIWGDGIDERDYLPIECQKIVNVIRDISWYTRGMTRYGNPKHPIKVTYAQEMKWFPVQDYLFFYDVITEFLTGAEW